MSAQLAEMARQIRHHTLELLQATPEPWLLWAPAGTSNHVLWHAGHALWLQDVLCVQPITGSSQLPANWADSFGQHCRPVRETRKWPQRDLLQQLLQRQLAHMIQLFRDHSQRLTDASLVQRVIHGLHDEARHQGEMYLLLKLCRSVRDGGH
jgi:hypothetical protein